MSQPAAEKSSRLSRLPDFDARADVNAVAAVTHALLTARPPFLLARALSVDPGGRPASARDLAAQLEAVTHGALLLESPAPPAAPAAAAPAAVAPSSQPEATSWSVRLVVGWAAAAFLVSLATTYAVLVTP